MTDTAELPHREVRPCGECSMCCKLLSIEKRTDGGAADFPFDKPANKWCKHCLPGHGCRLFNSPELPNLCKQYACVWKFAGDDPALPEDCRPDKLHAIFQTDEHPDFPGQMVLRIILDTEKPVSLRLRQLMDALRPEVSVLIAGVGLENGLITSNNLELAKALEARERSRARS